MPVTVFPAPGFTNSRQFICSFSGFDIAPVSGGTFTNLLNYSENQNSLTWFKGPGATASSDQYGLTTLLVEPVQYNIVESYLDNTYTSEELIVASTPNLMSVGKTVTVKPNTTYTFSFYAKLGTATNTTYGVYDNTNGTDIVSATSYTSLINSSTLTRITTTFTTGSNTTSISVLMLWKDSTAGTTIVQSAQLEVGSTATVYQTMGARSFAGTVASTVASTPTFVSKLKNSFVIKGTPSYKTNTVLQKDTLKTTAYIPRAIGRVAAGVSVRADSNILKTALLKKDYEIVKAIPKEDILFDAAILPKDKLVTPPYVLRPTMLMKPFEITKGDSIERRTTYLKQFITPPAKIQILSSYSSATVLPKTQLVSNPHTRFGKVAPGIEVNGLLQESIIFDASLLPKQQLVTLPNNISATYLPKQFEIAKGELINWKTIARIANVITPPQNTQVPKYYPSGIVKPGIEVNGTRQESYVFSATHLSKQFEQLKNDTLDAERILGKFAPGEKLSPFANDKISYTLVQTSKFINPTTKNQVYGSATLTGKVSPGLEVQSTPYNTRMSSVAPKVVVRPLASRVNSEQLDNYPSNLWNYQGQVNLGQVDPAYNNTFSVTGTFVAPYSNAYFSYFNGSSSVYNIGNTYVATGNFTFEGWYYFTGSGQNDLFSIGNESSGRVVFFQTGTTGALSYNPYGGSSVSLTATTVANNTWTHIAVSRVGSSVTTYVNGIAGSPITLSGSVGNANGFQVMGTNNAGTIGGQGAGFVSNFRYVNGTAVRTGTFTPPTANLTAVANTQLLLFLTNIPSANSASSTNTISSIGTVTGTIASGYTALQFNPTYGAVTTSFQTYDVVKLADSTSTNNLLVQTNGATNFSSTLAYLQVPTSILSNFASFSGNNWTFQQWSPSVYTAAQVSNANLNTYLNTPLSLVNTSTNPWYNYFLSTAPTPINKVGTSFNILTTGSREPTVGNYLKSGTVRAGNVAKGTVNNIASGKVTSGVVLKSTPQSPKPYKLAQTVSTSVPDFSFLVTGRTPTISYNTAAWYTEILPTEDYVLTGTPVSNATTTLSFAKQLNPTSVFDVGSTARISNAPGTALPYTYYENTSLYFDSTIIYRTAGTLNANAIFGTNNFTIEAWVYLTGNPGVRTDILGDYLPQTGQFFLYRAASGFAVFGFSTSTTVSNTITGTTQQVVANAWNHIAAVRNGTIITLYVNGIADGTFQVGTAPINYTQGGFAPPSTGSQMYAIGYGSGGTQWIGYLSNIRIVNGTAVYSGNSFLVPRTSLTAIPGTTLLVAVTPEQVVDLSSNKYTMVLYSTGQRPASIPVTYTVAPPIVSTYAIPTITVRTQPTDYVDVVVTASDSQSITFATPNRLPLGILYVETGASVIQQVDVHPTASPKNARENLFYSTLARGFRGIRSSIADSTATPVVTTSQFGLMAKQFEQVRNDTLDIKRKSGLVNKYLNSNVQPIITGIPFGQLPKTNPKAVGVTTTIRPYALADIDSSLWYVDGKVNVGQAIWRDTDPSQNFMNVSSTSVSGSNTVISIAAYNATGQALFTPASQGTVLSTTWTVPAGVSSISFFMVGPGGNSQATGSGNLAGSGGGGSLYATGVTVTPGTQLQINIGSSITIGAGLKQGDTVLTFPTGQVFTATGGFSGSSNVAGTGGTGTFSGTGNYQSWANANGGPGGTFIGSGSPYGAGGGGAAGYGSTGGLGGNSSGSGSGTAGGSSTSGGGGGSGANDPANAGAGTGAGGGGVGLLGSGTGGTGGTKVSGGSSNPGTGGSGGTSGVAANGGTYGGGAASGSGYGGQGAIRIIWGTGRAYPSTLTTDQSSSGGATGIIKANEYIKITDAVGNSVLAKVVASNTPVASNGTITVATSALSSLTAPASSWTVQTWSPTVYTNNQVATAYPLIDSVPTIKTPAINNYLSSNLSPIDPIAINYNSLTSATAELLNVKNTLGQLPKSFRYINVQPMLPDDTIRRSGKLTQWLRVSDVLPDATKRRVGKVNKFTVDRFATPTPLEIIRRNGKVSFGLRAKEAPDNRKTANRLSNYDSSLWNYNGQSNIGQADAAFNTPSFTIVSTVPNIGLANAFTALFVYPRYGAPNSLIRVGDIIKVTDALGNSVIVQTYNTVQFSNVYEYVSVLTSDIASLQTFSSTNYALNYTGAGATSYATNAAYAFGSGNWTIEGYVNVTSVGANGTAQTIVQRATAGANAVAGDWSLNIYSVSGLPVIMLVAYDAGTTSYAFVGLTSIGTSTWVHFAVVRNGNTMSLYLNGTLYASAAFTATFAANSQPINVGRNVGNTSGANFGGYWPGSSNYLNAQLSSLRITVGKAVYFGNGGFVPPKPPLQTTQAGDYGVSGLVSTDVVFLLSTSTIDSSYIAATPTVIGTGPSLITNATLFGGNSNWTLQPWNTQVRSVAQFNTTLGGNMYGARNRGTEPLANLWRIIPGYNPLSGSQQTAGVNGSLSPIETATPSKLGYIPQDYWYNAYQVNAGTSSLVKPLQGTTNPLNIVRSTYNSNNTTTFAINKAIVTNSTGQAAFTTPGTYSWTAPAGVYFVSVVAVGGGGSGAAVTSNNGGGGGGGLGWKNNIPVSPGTTYTIAVGAGGAGFTTRNVGNAGGDSYFISPTVVKGGGGGAGGINSVGGTGGSFVGDGGGTGGLGGYDTTTVNESKGGGGGGAGGYTGSGGNGASSQGNTSPGTAATPGSGGGGGGGAALYGTFNGNGNAVGAGAGGGGVGILGQGLSGVAYSNANDASGGATALGGGGGSGGTDGGNSVAVFAGGQTSGAGGVYGGGSGGTSSRGGFTDTVNAAGGGAVRIIWGSGRAFPSTLTADQPTTSTAIVMPVTYNISAMDYVKITDTVSKNSRLVQVQSVKSNGEITINNADLQYLSFNNYDAINYYNDYLNYTELVPASALTQPNALVGLTVEMWDPSVYTQSQAFNANINQPIYVGGTPSRNLFLAYSAPVNSRGILYSPVTRALNNVTQENIVFDANVLFRERLKTAVSYAPPGKVSSGFVVKSLADKRKAEKLSQFSPIDNTSVLDYSFVIAGYNDTQNYNTVANYSEISPTEDYIYTPAVVQSGTTTLYFSNSQYIVPFDVGSTALISNTRQVAGSFTQKSLVASWGFISSAQSYVSVFTNTYPFSAPFSMADNQSFTIEFWLNLSSTSAGTTRNIFMGINSSGFGTFGVRISTSNTLAFDIISVATIDTGYAITNYNSWNHITIIRQINGMSFWVNGSRVYSISGGNVNNGWSATWGQFGLAGGLSLSNFRFTNTVVYPFSASTFDVPTTTLSNIPGTLLLTAQTTQFVDNSTNNLAFYTVSVNATTVNPPPLTTLDIPVYFKTVPQTLETAHPISATTSVTVLSSTRNSITFATPSTPLPAAGTAFVSTGSTVYAKEAVHPTVSPKNARENLFYSTLARGLYGIYFPTGGDGATPVITADPFGLLPKTNPKAVSINEDIKAFGLLDKDRLKTVDPNVKLRVNTLAKAYEIVKSTPFTLRVDQIPKANPVAVSINEDLKAFGKISAGAQVRADSAILKLASLPKQFEVIKGDQLILRPEKIKNFYPTGFQGQQYVPSGSVKPGLETNGLILDSYAFDINTLVKPYEIATGLLNERTLLRAGRVSAGNRAYGLTLEAVAFDINLLPKQFEVIKGDQLRLRPEQVKNFYPAKGSFQGQQYVPSGMVKPGIEVNGTGQESYVFDVTSLNKAYEKINGITQDGYVFDATILTKEQLRTTDRLRLSFLPKQLEVIKGDQLRLRVDRISPSLEANGLAKDAVNYRTNLLGQFKTPAIKTHVQPSYGIGRAAAITKIGTSVSTLKPNKLQIFDPVSSATSTPDFTALITGKPETVSYNVVDLYLDLLTTEDYLLTGTNIPAGSTTTYYFAKTNFIIDVGSNIFIGNDQAGYKESVTVVASTSNSVTFVTPPRFWAGLATYISTGATVIQQQYYGTSLPPTTPRDNLYYSNIAPTLRGYSIDFTVKASREVKSNLTADSLPLQLEKIKGIAQDGYVFDATILTKEQLRTTDRLKVSFLPLQVEKIKGDLTVLRTDIAKVALIAKGDTNNIKVNYLEKNKYVDYLRPLWTPPMSSMSKQLFTLRADRTKLTTDKVAVVDRAYGLIFENNLSRATFLPLQIEKIGGDRTRLSADKLNAADVLKGDKFKFEANQFDKLRVKNLTVFETPKFSAFKPSLVARADRVRFDITPAQFDKLKVTQLQVFDTPKSAPVKASGILRADRVVFKTENLSKQFEIVKSDRVLFRTENLPLQVEQIKGDKKFVYSVEQVLNPFTIRKNQISFFETPRLSVIKSGGALRADKTNLFAGIVKAGIIAKGDRAVFRTDSLPLQIEKIKADQITFRTENLSKQFEIIKGDNRFFYDVEQLNNPFALRANQVSFFETPKSASVKASGILRADRIIFRTENLSKQFETIKGDRKFFYTVEQLLNPFKIRANQVSFFETPKFSPLRVDGVLKGDKLILSTEQLLKAYEIIKADKTNLFAGTVKAGNRAYGLTLESVAFEVNQLAKQLEIVKGDQFKFRVDQFDKIRVKDVTLFNTPKSSTFKISGVVTGDRIRLRTENLPLQVEKVKDGYAKLSTDSLTKAYEIIRSDKVPYAPPAQVKSVKVPTNATEVFYTPKVDKLNSTDVLRDSKARLTTDKLNSTDVLKDLQYNIGVSALQKAYETLREELAGRRIKAEHMSLIDNQGAFGTDPLPIMQVSNVFYDTSTWYLYDEDQLVPTILYNTLTQTIVFQNTTPWLFLPGSTVVLTDSFTLNQFTATILASTPNSVTIVSIPGFPSTVALGTIRSASVEVFPQSAVFTNTTPKNPRENLYYFNITPAFRADRWQQIGSYSTTYTSNRIVNDNRQTGRLAASEKVKSPGKQLVNSLAFGKSSGIRIKQSVDSALLNVASLEKYKEPARNNFTFSLDTIGLVDLRDFVREATNPRTLDVGVLAQVPRPPNAELAYQVFYLPLSGNLAKFKTGDFKLGSVGVQDLNYTKQQPIQFWS